jgi:hypothetical protein
MKRLDISNQNKKINHISIKKYIKSYAISFLLDLSLELSIILLCLRPPRLTILSFRIHLGLSLILINCIFCSLSRFIVEYLISE